VSEAFQPDSWRDGPPRIHDIVLQPLTEGIGTLAVKLTIGESVYAEPIDMHILAWQAADRSGKAHESSLIVLGECDAGGFRRLSLPEGPYRLLIAGAPGVPSVNWSRDVEVVAGSAACIELDLPFAVLDLEIVDPDGVPITRGWVWHGDRGEPVARRGYPISSTESQASFTRAASVFHGAQAMRFFLYEGNHAFRVVSDGFQPAEISGLIATKGGRYHQRVQLERSKE
jgi:hypothetical protein